MQDSILFWNAVALEAVRVSHSDPGRRQQNGPTLSSRALAIVHLAMYDAYAGIVGGAGFPRYLPAPAPPPPPPPPPPATLSAPDAVAGAAFATLRDLYSLQTAFFEAQLSAFDRTSDSFAFGVTVGTTLLALRRNDMDARDGGYTPSMKRFRHRRDPDNPGQGFHAPFYGAQTRTFAVSERHALKPPPLEDAKYIPALRQVRAKGIRPDLTATLPDDLFAERRTAEQTLQGIYWGYDGANRLGTPPRLYNDIIRKVAMNVPNPKSGKTNDEGQNARLFAFVNAAMGDAGILCWEQKYCHDLWRPVVGIREHDEDFGPGAPHKISAELADGDPGWLPLGAPSTNTPGMKNFTPDFPAYPSGHATFGAAAFHITRMFYGIKPDNISPDKLLKGLFFVSDEYDGINRDNEGTVRPRHTRHFSGGLWEMIMENALSRIFLGVHWIFDAFDFRVEKKKLVPDLTDLKIGGVGLGLRIARDVFKHGGNGTAPQMTPQNPPPAKTEPPITTPAPGSPMPAAPQQPASVKGCADHGKKAAGGKEGAWPEGVSPQAEGAGTEASAHQAWPSGISEK